MFLPRILIALAVLAASSAGAEESAAREGGEIIFTENEVDRGAADAKWTKAAVGDGVKWREQVRTGELSRAGIETLAIIAYHEPVSRAEIEAIRGVQISKGTLDVLMEAGWVRPAGRRETPGRPLTFATTPAFLAHFGLETRRDLPGIDDLRAAGLLDPVDLAFEAMELPETGAEAEELESDDDHA